MLQRVPVILAVTASSYGLALPAEGSRKPAAGCARRHGERVRAAGKPAMQR